MTRNYTPRRPKCTVDGCPTHPTRGTICAKHKNLRPRPPKAPKGECAVEGCTRIARSSKPGSLCLPHYGRMRNFGDTQLIRERPPTTCHVIGCQKKISATREFCRSHARLIAIYGLPAVPTPTFTSPLERFLQRLPRPSNYDDCWIWDGALRSTNTMRDGYGYTWLGKGGQPDHRIVYTHRLMYEYMIGPIPDGLVLDHLCCNTRCCNPKHLEPVTSAENIRRGIERKKRK